MNIKGVSIALLVSLAATGPAFSFNEMILRNPDDLASLAVVEITGSYNRLVIDQVSTGEGVVNSVNVTIEGDRNGGPAGAAFGGVAVRNGLMPGEITQRGLGNSVDFDVRGSDNLFAVAQIGNDNAVWASIVGYGNQSSVYQTGNGNFASLSQNGIGNIISVSQTAW